jgi:hypothetical protein
MRDQMKESEKVKRDVTASLFVLGLRGDGRFERKKEEKFFNNRIQQVLQLDAFNVAGPAQND